jgi:pyrimidine-nucleoside phosphorylase
VKVGSGSTLPTYEKSKELALNLLKTSKDFGQRAIAILTSMDSPLGYAIGNWAEIRECIEIMNPKAKLAKHSADLLEVTLYLAGAMLQLAGKCVTIEEGIKLAGEKLTSGECFNKFVEMTKLQGGDTTYIVSPEKYSEAKFTDKITASSAGFVVKLDALTFGLAAVELGCGRKTVEDKIDYSSVILLEKKLGSAVKAGDTICSISGETKEQVRAAKEILIKGITISKNKPEPESRIIEVIN